MSDVPRISATTAPVDDARPETPTPAVIFVVRYQEWEGDGPHKVIANSWRDRLSMFPMFKVEEAHKQAQELLAKGCRNVNIVTIPAP